MLAIFLDIETTGLDTAQHCPIDIALKVVNISTHTVLASYQRVIKPTKEKWQKSDPVSLKVNGYTWDQLEQGVSIEIVGLEIIELLTSLHIERGSTVFICQNPAFDRSFFAQFVDVYTQEKLNWPYHWLDLASMYWATLHHKCAEEKTKFPEKISLSKNLIAQAYQILPESEPHHAMNGVEHLIKCYQAVLGIGELTT